MGRPSIAACLNGGGCVYALGMAQQGLSRAELIKTSGLAAEQVDLAIDAGLLVPDNSGLFNEDAVVMLQAGASLVDAGVSVPDLARLAVRHARNVEAVVDEAVDLFLAALGIDALNASDLENLHPLVEDLVPKVVVLVGEHFRRTLLSRAVDRLAERVR
ncbi:MAG: hypothetical protein F4138_02365 [Acidimicrobiia bacterium]|nr:hypothetical protein [Acidimicrobiia bacterium]